jgi:hypothetical protein
MPGSGALRQCLDVHGAFCIGSLSYQLDIIEPQRRTRPADWVDYWRMDATNDAGFSRYFVSNNISSIH